MVTITMEALLTLSEGWKNITKEKSGTQKEEDRGCCITPRHSIPGVKL